MTRFGSSAPYWLDPEDKTTFPDVNEALLEPDGLLAIGGDLSVERLLAAYRHGIFPWYSDGQPILWWAPNPRAVLFLNEIKISRSLRKSLRRNDYIIKLDCNFKQVIKACSTPRSDGLGTWITDEMMHAYIDLHNNGYAHCVEVWRENELIGGLYGVASGHVYFGESMFSKQTDASKIALVFLTRQLQKWGYGLIDCQIYTEHLESLGARLIPRSDFTSLLDDLCGPPGNPGIWQFELCVDDVLLEL